MERRGNDEQGNLNPISKTLNHNHNHFNKDSNPNPDPDPVQIPTTSNSRPSPDIADVIVRYRECQKNHAASMGGHVVDGCGEFMPGGDESTPEALKCAACECHRSFHRRESDGQNHHYAQNNVQSNIRRSVMYPVPVQHPPPPHQLYAYSNVPNANQNPNPNPNPNPPVLVTFDRNPPTKSWTEDLNMFQSNAGNQPGVQPSFSGPKKRFRTKFSREQKDKMQEFAEKLGWKMQKQDDEEVERFCRDFGLKRQVFKVWMHNNKQVMKNKHL